MALQHIATAGFSEFWDSPHGFPLTRAERLAKEAAADELAYDEHRCNEYAERHLDEAAAPVKPNRAWCELNGATYEKAWLAMMDRCDELDELANGRDQIDDEPTPPPAGGGAARTRSPLAAVVPTGDPAVLSWAADLARVAYLGFRRLELAQLHRSKNLLRLKRHDDARLAYEQSSEAGLEAEALADMAYRIEVRDLQVSASYDRANRELTAAAAADRGQLRSMRPAA